MIGRGRILEDACALTTGDRQDAYGDCVTNQQGIAAFWALYIQQRYGVEIPLAGEDVAHMMTLLKIQRTTMRLDEARVDNYIDAAAYQGIAGECAGVERGQGAID